MGLLFLKKGRLLLAGFRGFGLKESNAEVARDTSCAMTVSTTCLATL